MYVPNKIGTNLTQSLFYKRAIPIQANVCILLKESTIKMTQTGFIFRAGRTPVNGRTIANKVGASVRKRKTTGTHHLFRANPLHYIHATPCDERRIICCKEKEANDCVQDIMNNIIQQRYAKQRIYFSRADHHSFRNFFPLKKKANAKDKTRRVARLYIRIGFKERIREQRKI